MKRKGEKNRGKEREGERGKSIRERIMTKSDTSFSFSGRSSSF